MFAELFASEVELKGIGNQGLGTWSKEEARYWKM